MALSLSIFTDSRDALAEVRTTSFAEFAGEFAHPTVIDEVATEAAAKEVKAHAMAWSPATFVGGRRLKTDIDRVHLLVFDIDGADGKKAGVPVEPLLTSLRGSGLNYVVHSTTSSGFTAPGQVKARVALELDRPATSVEYSSLWTEWSKKLNLPPDETRHGGEGIFYLPIIFREHQERYVFEARTDGEPIVVGGGEKTFRRTIGEARPFGTARDEEQWLTHVRTASLKDNALKSAVFGAAIARLRAGLSLDGLTELFLQALRENTVSDPVVDWDLAREHIEKFIQNARDAFEQEEEERETEKEETRAATSSKLGLIGQKHLTKLIKEVEKGLVAPKEAANRLGRFAEHLPGVDLAHLLEQAARKAPSPRMKSILELAQEATDIQEGIAEGKKRTVGKVADWTARMTPTTNAQTGETYFAGNALNIAFVLADHPDMQEVIALCNRREFPVYRKDPPWTGKGAKEGEPLKEHHGSLAMEWLGDKRNKLLHGTGLSPKAIGAAIMAEAAKNTFDPVLDYFDTLPVATGCETLERVLIDYAGVEDSPYVRLVTRLWFTAAYAVQVRPGTRLEGALILQGAQAAGKSTFFSIIFPEDMRKYTTSDFLPKWEDKDIYVTLSRFAVVELAELADIKPQDQEKIKAIMTNTGASIRQAYGSLWGQLDRRCVFGGSSNHERFLNDTTGNRRFWPVKVGAIDFDAIGAIRDQLWSEARFCFENGMKWWARTEEEKALVHEASLPFLIENPLEAAVDLFFSSQAGTGRTALVPYTDTKGEVHSSQIMAYKNMGQGVPRWVTPNMFAKVMLNERGLPSGYKMRDLHAVLRKKCGIARQVRTGEGAPDRVYAYYNPALSEEARAADSWSE